MSNTLSHAEVRAFYDRFGMKQDRQPFEEDAIARLLEIGRFSTAQSVLEFGCGTGKAAVNILRNRLPASATYTGIDASSTMVGITRERLAPFGSRASVQQSDGAMQLPFANASFDRFLSSYVLDLLSEADIAQLVAEARRVLVPGGLLVVTSLTHGRRLHEKLIEQVWMTGFRIRPNLVGGCRPIRIHQFVPPHKGWTHLHNETVTQLGFCSELLVAERGD